MVRGLVIFNLFYLFNILALLPYPNSIHLVDQIKAKKPNFSKCNIVPFIEMRVSTINGLIDFCGILTSAFKYNTPEYELIKLGHMLNNMDDKHVSQYVLDIVHLVKKAHDNLIKQGKEPSNPNILLQLPGGTSVGIVLKDPQQVNRITSCFLDLGKEVSVQLLSW